MPRQRGQRLVQHVAQFDISRSGSRRDHGALQQGQRAGPAASFPRRAASHLVQPAGDRFVPAQGARLARQDEEGRLKGVLGGVVVAQQPPARPQDHRPVAADQLGERGLIVRVRVPAQQLRVGEHAPLGRGPPL
jgi:hypothetical protein